MHIHLAYGSGQVPVDVPDNWINGRCYRPRTMEPMQDIRAGLDAALAELPDNLALSALAQDKTRALIALDSTAPELLETLLPLIVEALETQAGIPPGKLTLLFSNPPWGTPMPPGKLVGKLPSRLRMKAAALVHDPRDSAHCAEPPGYAGQLPLRVNKAYMEAPLRIILGGVRPDMFLGFTGGRAVVLPGLAGEEALSALTSFNSIASRNTRAGNFRDNPFHLAGMEALHAAGCDLLVSAVLNASGDIHTITAGDPRQSHVAAMSAAREAMVVKVKEPMDIVVTSGGGAPLDGTLWDLVHTLGMVLPVLKKGGTIIAAAALEKGIGPPQFEELLSGNDSIRTTLRQISLADQRGPAHWVAQKLLNILEEHEVILYNTNVDEDLLWRTGLTPVRDINEAILGAMESHGQRCKIVALPDGPLGIGELLTRGGSGERNPRLPIRA